MESKTINKLTKTLELHARGLGIPSGSAEIFIEKSLAATQKSLADRAIVTENDIVRAVSKELKKYNPDLAYVYQNRDKII